MSDEASVPQMSQEEEGKFVKSNLEYIEKFLNNCRERENELSAEAKENLFAFKENWSQYFSLAGAGSHNGTTCYTLNKPTAESGTIPKTTRSKPLILDTDGDSLDDTSEESLSLSRVDEISDSSSPRSKVVPNLIYQQPNLTEWMKILDRLDQRRVAALETFDEDSGLNLRQYFKKFENYCRDNFRGSSDTWIGELENHLRGKTLQAFKASKDVHDSYNDIKGKLIEWFEDMKDVMKERNKVKFRNAAMEPDESTNIYATRLERLFRLAYPMRLPNTNRTLQEKFVSTVPKPFRKFLESQIMTSKMNEEQMTWKRIIKSSRHYDLRNETQPINEEIVIHVGQRTRFTDATTQCESEFYKPSMNYNSRFDMQARRKQITTMREENQPIQPNNRTFWRATNEDQEFVASMSKKCTHCRRMGHEVQECRSRWKLCFICGADNHFLRQCPNYDQTTRNEVKGKRSQSQPAIKSRPPRNQGSTMSLNNGNAHLN